MKRAHGAVRAPARRIPVRVIASSALAACLCATPCAQAATPAIAAGSSHGLALGADGRVRVWGDDSFGQLGFGRQLLSTSAVTPSGLSNFQAVSAGAGSSFALGRDGTLWSWGANPSGQLGDGTAFERSEPRPVPGLPAMEMVSGPFEHVMAVGRDGKVRTWGSNQFGQLGDGTTVDQLSPIEVPLLDAFVAVSAGIGHSVALKADGSVWAWGANGSGQRGDSTTLARGSPARVIGADAIKAIAAGGNHTLAVRGDGTLLAWGSNAAGQVGDGGTATAHRFAPTQITLPGAVVAVAAGEGHSLALLSDGSVYAWGSNLAGQLGDGTTVNRIRPQHVPGVGAIVAISAGRRHSAALRSDGVVVAWGENREGQLGDGTRTNRLKAVVSSVVSGVGSVAVGGSHTIAALADGTIRSWGANANGQLGDGGVSALSTPAILPSLTGVVAISARHRTNAVIRLDGRVHMWGANTRGQLGDGTNETRSSPTPVVGLPATMTTTTVACGTEHTLAITTDGSVYAWGSNRSGQVTGSSGGDRFAPVRVSFISNAIAIAAGGSGSLAVTADGAVHAWGGAAVAGSTRVPDLGGIVAVAAGATHYLALRNDGAVFAWGGNNAGQLGEGTLTYRFRPVPVTGLGRVIAISAGDNTSLALRSDGAVFAWGANAQGELGDGTTIGRRTPVQVSGASDVVSISMSTSDRGAHGLGLRADGSVASWGYNAGGQVGDGTLAQRLRAVLVRREEGAGSLEGGDWFFDLQPSVAAAIPADLTPPLLVTVEGAGSNVIANVKYRAQDIGTTASTFVFAVAPADIVRSSATGEPALEISKALDGATRKELALSCVLAQLTSSGQLQAVSASSLQAFVTGVLSSQGQAVTVIGGASAVQIGGAIFYVGYGPNASAMLSGGLNRSVTTVPGAKECRPGPPAPGWWWYPSEDGRGYSIEVQGKNIFFAAFLYDTTGRSDWYVATGPTSLDGSLFAGNLLSVKSGQTLSGPYRAPSPVTTVGPITLAFSNATSGTMVWPGGTVPLERFSIVPDGLTAPAQANVPESGWWWNPAESGRGFFIEWQNGHADIAGYMYDDAGNAVWYLTVVPTPDPRKLAGSWWSFANGMTLAGPWKPHTRINDNVAPVSIEFHSRDTATLTLPGGRTTALVRHRF